MTRATVAAKKRSTATPRESSRPALHVPAQELRTAVSAIVARPSIQAIEALDEAVLMHTAMSDALIVAPRLSAKTRRMLAQVRRGWHDVEEQIGELRVGDANARRTVAAALENDVVALTAEEQQALTAATRELDARATAAVTSAIASARDELRRWLDGKEG